MGNQVLGFITKGVVHTKIDKAVNHRGPDGQFDKRAGFLADLLTAHTLNDYFSAIEKHAGVTPQESGYLRNTWYNAGPGGWWINVQPVYQRVRWGLIKSIQEAGTTRILDSYWCPAGETWVFQVLVMRSAAQVTRIILTPASPMDAPVSRPHKAPTWAFKGRQGTEQVGEPAKGIKATETATEIVESIIQPVAPGGESVVVWRVKEWEPQSE